MATPRDSTRELLRAVTRLAGPPIRKARHGQFFRVLILSSDGHKYAVTLQVNTHRGDQPSKAAFKDLANRLRISHAGIDEVLDHWTSDQLKQHLSSLPKEELRSQQPIP